MPKDPADLGAAFQEMIEAMLNPNLQNLEKAQVAGEAQRSIPTDHVVINVTGDAATGKAIRMGWQLASKLVTKPAMMTDTAWNKMKTAPLPGWMVVCVEMSDGRNVVLNMRRSPPPGSLS